MLLLQSANQYFGALILLIFTTATCRAQSSSIPGCYRKGETCESLTGRRAYEKQTVTRNIASCPEGDTTRVLLDCEPRRKLS
jgi:hypothetical protein